MSITNNSINVKTPAPLDGTYGGASAVVGASTTGGVYGFNYYSIPGKNRIVNGDFSIMQPGSFVGGPGGSQQKSIPGGTTGQDTYCFDRWQLLCTRNCTATQCGGTSANSVIGLGYYARVGRDDGQAGGTTVKFGTTLIPELAAGMNGNPLTHSFLIRKGDGFSAPGNILTVKVFASTGITLESGLTHGWTEIHTTDIALTGTFTNWAFTIPPKTDAYRQFALQFSYDTDALLAANDYFELANVQWELSPKQTPFEYVLPPLQLLRCQRYYYKSFDYGTLPAAGAGFSTGAIGGDRIPGYPVGSLFVYMGLSITFRFPVTLLQIPAYVQLSNAGTLRIYNTRPSPQDPLKIGSVDVAGSRLSFTPQIESISTQQARFLSQELPGNTGGINNFAISAAHFTVFADVV